MVKEKVQIYMASDAKIPGIIIEISGKFPDDITDLNQSYKLHTEQADKIVDALWKSLPQATRKRVTAKLVIREAGLLQKLYWPTTKTGEEND